MEEAPRPPHLRARFDALFQDASRAVAEYLRRCPDVHVGYPDLAAQMVVRIVESITHGLVIHPAAGAGVDSFVDETVLLLRRYLNGC